MPFAFEFDLARNEIKKSVGGTIKTYVKTNVTGTSGNTLSTCAISVYDNANNLIASNPSGLAINAVENSVLIPIDSGLDYGEGYRVELDVVWTAIGFGTSAHTYETVPFSVVYQPWGQPLVGYNDMVAMRPSLSASLATEAARVNQTADDLARFYSYRAHTELDNWIRNAATTAGEIRAAAIYDKEKLADIELMLAIYFFFNAITTGDENNSAEKLRRNYWADALSRFQSLKISFDSNDDGLPDAVAEFNTIKIRFGRL